VLFVVSREIAGVSGDSLNRRPTEDTVAASLEDSAPVRHENAVPVLADGPACPSPVQRAPALPEPSPPPAAVPALTAFDQRLRAATRWTPVTLLAVAANVAVFAAMAVNCHRLLDFNSNVLMSWGGAYAPRIFHGEAWRAATSLFVHGGLGHLASNLCFLLLIAPLVERLLGSVRFAAVYLFAGLGGSLLMLAVFPASVAVGASGAVYGVYGAFLGCFLRAPRIIPWQVFGRQVGLLVAYMGIGLVVDYFDLRGGFVAHAGGLLFGLLGGLLFGHVLRRRGLAWRFCHVSVAVAVCAGVLGLTAWGAWRCSDRAVKLLARYDAALDRERALRGQFHEALERWADGSLTAADLERLLREQLIPEWDRARTQLGLMLPPQYAHLESQRLSMRELMAQARGAGPSKKQHEEGALSDQDFDEAYRLCLKLQVDNWRTLADGFRDGRSTPIEALMDMVWVEVLRKGLDEEINEQSPPCRWLPFPRKRFPSRN
jgi:membrane associated rhomboid family serine protease